MNAKTENLKAAVSEAFQVGWEELLIRSRKYDRVLARKTFIHIARKELKAGPTEISKLFGFDNSTISFHSKKINDLLDANDFHLVTKIDQVKAIFNRLNSAQ